MKKLIYAVLIVGIVASFVPSIIGAPLMTMSETEFDFGYVPQNSKVSHVFWIHSAGDDSLKILKVIPG